MRSGDVLILNRCSYVDILYASATYAPVFTATTQEGGLRIVSLMQALSLALRGSPQRFAAATSASSSESAAAAEASTGNVLELVLRAGAGGGPIAVFPEGAPTNNNAVLVFTPVADQIARAVLAITRARTGAAAASLRVPTVHVLALAYSPTGGGASTAAGAGGRGGSVFTPTFTGPAGSALAHAWWLAAQASNSLTVMRLPEGFEPQPADFAAPPAADASKTPVLTTAAAGGGSGLAVSGDADDAAAVEPPSFSRAVRNALAQLLHGRRAVALGAGHYDAYLNKLVESRARAADDRKKRT